MAKTAVNGSRLESLHGSSRVSVGDDRSSVRDGDRQLLRLEQLLGEHRTGTRGFDRAAVNRLSSGRDANEERIAGRDFADAALKSQPRVQNEPDERTSDQPVELSLNTSVKGSSDGLEIRVRARVWRKWPELEGRSSRRR